MSERGRGVHRLWAPWRLEFVKTAKEPGCIFGRFVAGAPDRDHLVLGRTALSFAMLNKFPYNNGHLMVIPRRHSADLGALPEAEFADLHRLLQLSVSLLTEAYRPEGLNVGMNLGKCAGAGIDDHLHYHVVPRWGGDTNYMPLLSETKVMIEHLSVTYDRLRPLFDRSLGSAG